MIALRRLHFSTITRKDIIIEQNNVNSKYINQATRKIKGIFMYGIVILDSLLNALHRETILPIIERKVKSMYTYIHINIYIYMSGYVYTYIFIFIYMYIDTNPRFFII